MCYLNCLHLRQTSADKQAASEAMGNAARAIAARQAALTVRGGHANVLSELGFEFRVPSFWGGEIFFGLETKNSKPPCRP